MATLLDTTGLGIVQLDGRGRIVAANDRARDVIRTGEGLFDVGGFLHARLRKDDAKLQAVLARALPPFGVQGAAGSTMVSRPSPLPPLALHVNPVVRAEKHDPHACEAHVRQASPIASGGPGATGAFAGRPSGIPALKTEAAADQR